MFKIKNFYETQEQRVISNLCLRYLHYTTFQLTRYIMSFFFFLFYHLLFFLYPCAELFAICLYININDPLLSTINSAWSIISLKFATPHRFQWKSVAFQSSSLVWNIQTAASRLPIHPDLISPFWPYTLFSNRFGTMRRVCSLRSHESCEAFYGTTSGVPRAPFKRHYIEESLDVHSQCGFRYQRSAIRWSTSATRSRRLSISRSTVLH